MMISFFANVNTVDGFLVVFFIFSTSNKTQKKKNCRTDMDKINELKDQFCLGSSEKNTENCPVSFFFGWGLLEVYFVFILWFLGKIFSL